MKPAPFEYIRPSDVNDALVALGGAGPDAKVIAGGQSLVPMLNLRMASPTVLVDIDRLGLDHIEADGATIRLGALVRQRALIDHDGLRSRVPIVSEAARMVGHPAIRNRGTLGGSLCHADPTAELAALAVLLDAKLDIASSRGTRVVTAEEFFLGPFMTVLEPDELLTEISFDPDAGGSWAFLELAERAGDFAIVAVGVQLRAEDRLIRKPRIVVAGVEGSPVRALQAEQILDGEEATREAIAAAADAAGTELDAQDDVRASAAFRRQATRVLVQRALVLALEREPRAA